jgi:hypothetical protein
MIIMALYCVFWCVVWIFFIYGIFRVIGSSKPPQRFTPEQQRVLQTLTRRGIERVSFDHPVRWVAAVRECNQWRAGFAVAATWEEAMNQVLKTEGPGIMIHALCPEGSGTELFPIDATPMRTSNLRG